MLKLNKHTKAKTKPKPTLIFQNLSHVCTYHCAQLLYTTQHRKVLINFPLIPQTIIIAEMLPTGALPSHYFNYMHLDTVIIWLQQMAFHTINNQTSTVLKHTSHRPVIVNPVWNDAGYPWLASTTPTAEWSELNTTSDCDNSPFTHFMKMLNKSLFNRGSITYNNA